MPNNDTYLNLARKVPYIKNYAENGIVKEIAKTAYSSPITLSNARNKELVSLNAYGYCSQSGTPTPTSPVPIVCNNGEIKVSPNLFNKSTLTTNKYIGASGNITSDGTNLTAITNKIYVNPNTDYTLSGVGNIYAASYGRSGYQYQADDTPITAITATQNSGKVTFTTASNCAYIMVMSCTPNIDTALLNVGTTPATYRPYGELYYEGTTETISLNGTNVATCANLLKVGTYQDTQEIISGYITRNVGVKVLKGDSGEGWQIGTDANSNTYYYMSLQGLVADVDGKCTHFTYNPNDTTNGYFVNDTDTLMFYPANNTQLDTVTKWTAWLAANTPILVYPIASPTTEFVSAQQLSTVVGDNTLTVSADSGIVNSLEVSAKYKGGR